MQIIPAIDIRNGKCVRLTQGDYHKEIIYNADPAVVAKQFEKDGATMLHIVDLDGAKDGTVTNLEVIKNILKEITIPIELGGGIRDKKTVKKLIEIGVSRVILGTVALENKKELKNIPNTYASQIAIALDSKNGRLMKKGWLIDGNAEILQTAKMLEELGVQRFIFTDITKDGTLTHPNYNDMKRLIDSLKSPIIASGGISTVSAIQKLKKIGAEGAILGKALYENTISIKEAIRC